MKLHHTILLAGLGNTGSHLAPLLARMNLADHLILADPDSVEEGNMAAQAYGPGDVGRKKSAAMAKHLAGINRDLKIESFCGELEDMPLGYFAGLVVLCLDHDAARQVAAERTWWMGGTLLDVAVNGSAGLARVSRIVRDSGRACLECGWSNNQYDKLQVRHSCRKTVAPTNAPAALGSFAASLAALQIQSPMTSDSNTEITSAPGSGEMWVSRLMKNAECRFQHHAPAHECLNQVDFTVPFGSLFSLLDTGCIEVPGFSFAGRGRCASCWGEVDILLLDRSARRPCPRCGEKLEFLPFHSRESVRPGDFPERDMSRRLDAVGLRPGDVVRTDHNRWIQLGDLRIES